MRNTTIRSLHSFDIKDGVAALARRFYRVTPTLTGSHHHWQSPPTTRASRWNHYSMSATHCTLPTSSGRFVGRPWCSSISATWPRNSPSRFASSSPATSFLIPASLYAVFCSSFNVSRYCSVPDCRRGWMGGWVGGWVGESAARKRSRKLATMFGSKHKARVIDATGHTRVWVKGRECDGGVSLAKQRSAD